MTNKHDFVTITDDGKIFYDLEKLENIEKSGPLGKSIYFIKCWMI